MRREWWIGNRKEFLKRKRVAWAQWYKENKDKVREYYKEAYRKDPEKYCKRSRDWLKKLKRNKKHYKEFRKKSRKKGQVERDGLHDNYIKKQLTIGTTLNSTDIPVWLIEVKRQQMKLYRLLKEVSNGGRAFNKN